MLRLHDARLHVDLHLHYTVSVIVCLCLVNLVSAHQQADAGPDTTSYYHVLKLASLESEMVDFCDYIIREELRIHEGQHAHGFDRIKRLIGKMSVDNERLFEGLDDVSGSPIEVYHLKKRFTLQWPPILEFIEESESELVQRIPTVKKKLVGMKEMVKQGADIEASIEDLLRLMKLFKISAEDMAAGRILYKTAPQMDALDLFKLADAANANDEHEMAMTFLTIGLNSRQDSLTDELRHRLTHMLGNTYIKLNKLDLAKDTYTKLLAEAPDCKTAKNNLKIIDQRMNDKKGDTSLDHHCSVSLLNETQDWVRYCNGLYAAYPSVTNDAICFEKVIKTKNMTVKIEQLHLQPNVTLIHGLFTSEELATIKQAAVKRISDEIVADNVFSVGEHAAHLTAKTSYKMKNIANKLRTVTFQDRRISDPDILTRFYVKNQGPSVKANPNEHHLSLMSHGIYTQNIGKYMIFLNDVGYGGGLVFPSLGLHIRPEKGLVVFWQFRDPYGHIHTDLDRHIHCPILLGTSWYASAIVKHFGVLNRIYFTNEQVETPLPRGNETAQICYTQ